MKSFNGRVAAITGVIISGGDNNIFTQIGLIVLVGLMLPGEDGLSLCRELRVNSNIPVVMLTAKGSLIDRIVGLEIGADDYLPKPFDPRELLVRIKVVLPAGVWVIVPEMQARPAAVRPVLAWD